MSRTVLEVAKLHNADEATAFSHTGGCQCPDCKGLRLGTLKPGDPSTLTAAHPDHPEYKADAGTGPRSFSEAELKGQVDAAVAAALKANADANAKQLNEAVAKAVADATAKAEAEAKAKAEAGS